MAQNLPVLVTNSEHQSRATRNTTMKNPTMPRIGELSLAILTLILTQLPASPAKADPISVFVGYADNLRASGFFPSPWLGAPGVVS